MAYHYIRELEQAERAPSGLWQRLIGGLAGFAGDPELVRRQQLNRLRQRIALQNALAGLDEAELRNFALRQALEQQSGKDYRANIEAAMEAKRRMQAEPIEAFNQAVQLQTAMSRLGLSPGEIREQLSAWGIKPAERTVLEPAQPGAPTSVQTLTELLTLPQEQQKLTVLPPGAGLYRGEEKVAEQPSRGPLEYEQARQRKRLAEELGLPPNLARYYMLTGKWPTDPETGLPVQWPGSTEPSSLEDLLGGLEIRRSIWPWGKPTVTIKRRQPLGSSAPAAGTRAPATPAEAEVLRRAQQGNEAMRRRAIELGLMEP